MTEHERKAWEELVANASPGAKYLYSDDEEISAAILAAARELVALREVAEKALMEVPVKCTCDDAYKSRKLTDPDCLYCDMVELRAAIAKWKEGKG